MHYIFSSIIITTFICQASFYKNDVVGSDVIVLQSLVCMSKSHSCVIDTWVNISSLVRKRLYGVRKHVY